MGDESMQCEGVGRIPPWGGPQADGEEILIREVWRVYIPLMEVAMAEVVLQEVDTHVSYH